MRFDEAYAGWQAGRLRQEEAARLLGVCERSFRRYIDRVLFENSNAFMPRHVRRTAACLGGEIDIRSAVFLNAEPALV